MSETLTAVVPYRSGDATDRADRWATLGEDERKRHAMEAARDHDGVALWDLTQSWLILHGRKGATVSLRTLASYCDALLPSAPPERNNNKARPHGHPLLDAWRHENLLHPGRMSGTRWLRGLEGAGMKPASVRVYLAAARTLYAALRSTGATTADPFKDLHASTDPVPRWEKRQPYGEDDVSKMLAVADPTERVLLLLGAHAGLRVSEMVALRWSDIGPGRATLVVQGGKGGKKRTIPLSGTLARALATLPVRHSTDRILPYRDRNAVYYRVRAITQRAGVTPLGVHSLRHYAGTRLVRETDNLEMASHLLGHSSVATTQIYAKWSDEGLKKTLAAW